MTRRRQIITGALLALLLALLALLALICALRSLAEAAPIVAAPTVPAEATVVRLDYPAARRATGPAYQPAAIGVAASKSAPPVAVPMSAEAWISLGTFSATAYCCCPECCGKAESDPAYGLTATGTRAAEGRTIAVDPAVIPYGTRVLVDGVAYIAEDCGAFEGSHIDIYMTDHDAARRFGVRAVEVKVKEGL